MLGQNIDIMAPQWLDVVFKDRNQAYGAYELRRNNPRNTNRALILAAGVFVFALSLPTIINKIQGFIPKKDPIINITNVTLPPPIEIEKVVPPAVQPEKQVVSQHDMIRDIPPVVRPDREAQEPPTDAEVLKADPGPVTMKGHEGADVVIDEKVGPKAVEGVTENTEDKDRIFVGVEVQPAFPGGDAAFNKFLASHIRYPNLAKENGVQGHVYIQFVVERDGSLTDMKIIRDPGSGLGDEALRVLKTSQRWSPGIQNGKPVRVQFTVPVNFSLAD